jgi:DNA polymerase-4
MILHVDMDAFFASIEQAINPRLKGKPLIVGSRPDKFKTVVCAANYEAKAFGIKSGMASAEAIRICPNIEFVPAQQAKYIWTSEKIFEMLKAYGFSTCYTSIDEFQIDIPDNSNPEAFAKDIQKRIEQEFRITASIGIARNWLLAKLASKLNKPNGIAIINENNLSETLKKTPADKLCGVGSKTGLVLESFGIKTCFDLYQKSSLFLEQILGKYGINLYVNLHSIESLSSQDNSQETQDKPSSVSHSYTLPKACETPGFIKAWLRLLSEMVGRRLRQENLAGKTVHIWLNGPEIGNFSRQKTFQQETDDGFEIYQRALKIIKESGLKKQKIRALGVTCGGIFKKNYLPFFNEQKRREGLIRAQDNINERFGEDTIFPASVILTKRMK